MGESSDAALNMENMIDGLEDERSRSGSDSSGYSSRKVERSSSEGSSSCSGISEAPRMVISKQISVKKHELDKENQTFAKRPGTIVDLNSMKKIHITTNFVKLIMSEVPIVLHQYSVKINPNNTSKKRQRMCTTFLWDNCVSQNSQIFPDQSKLVYNNGNMLWSQEQLNIRLQGITLSVKDDNNKDEIATVDITYSSILEFSKNVQLAPEDELTVSIGKSTASERNATTHHPTHLKTFEYNKYCLKIGLDNEMHEYDGASFTVRLIVPKIPMLDIELFRSASHTPRISLIWFIMDSIANRKVTLDEYMTDVQNLGNYGMTNTNREYLTRILENVTVQLNYGKRRRAFRFTKLTEQPATQLKFTVGNEKISVAQHFQNQNRSLKYPLLPCVIGPIFPGMTEHSLFPLELLRIPVDTQKFSARIAESQLSSTIRGAVRSSCDRLKVKENLAIERTNERGAEEVPALFERRELKQPSDSNLKERFVNVEAVVLDSPPRKAVDKGTKKIKKIVPSIITIQNRPNSDSNSKPIEFYHSNFQTLMEVLEQFGQPVFRRPSSSTNQPESPCLYYVGTHDQRKDDINDLRKQLKTIQDGMKNDRDLIDDGIQAVPLIIFIFANRCTTAYYTKEDNSTTPIDIISDYGIIKQLCDGELGMNCQGILQKTFNSINTRTCSIAHNLAFKILAKIGTADYMLEKEGKHENWKTLTRKENATLVLGINVAHRDYHHKIKDESTDIISNCSVAAVVGNINHQMTKFGESVLVKKRGEANFVVQIEDAISERIQQYKKNSEGVLPKHIVCYREGVVESEFERVFQEDKTAITKACENIDKAYQPKITYIIVSKDRYTRFGVPQQKDTEKKGCYVKPGTLVETLITSNNFFDFYLVSHSDPFGTSRPTHYYVLHDDWKPSVSFWQTITYAFTYAYARTTNSISKPAPVVYAQLCAKRAKDRLQAIAEMKRLVKERFHKNNDLEYKRLTEQLKVHQNLDGMLYC